MILNQNQVNKTLVIIAMQHNESRKFGLQTDLLEQKNQSILLEIYFLFFSLQLYVNYASLVFLNDSKLVNAV